MEEFRVRSPVALTRTPLLFLLRLITDNSCKRGSDFVDTIGSGFNSEVATGAYKAVVR